MTARSSPAHRNAGLCEDGPAPVVTDWLEPCGPAISALHGSGRFGSSADDTCSQGQCVFSDDATADCVRQGCTRPCTGDQECPRGATCYGEVCKPGLREASGFGLSCPE